MGAEVEGVQLSQLSDKGKDELALFVAQKKVVGALPANYSKSDDRVLTASM